MKIKWRIDPIPAPMTKAKIVASVGVRDESALSSLGVSKIEQSEKRIGWGVKGMRVYPINCREQSEGISSDQASDGYYCAVM